MNKRNIVVTLAVVCTALVVGTVIFNAVSFQNATPNPTSTLPQPIESPTLTPPTEFPSSLPPNPKTIIVPDDYPSIQAAIDNAL